MPQEIFDMTVANAALFDTEVVDPSVTTLTFFANTRQFSANGAGPKRIREHVNLLGAGGCLPRKHDFFAKAILVELEGASDDDRAMVSASDLSLYVAGACTERVRGKLALGSAGAQLVKPILMIEQEQVGVSWGPIKATGTFHMKVSILGVARVPVFDEESKARAREFYGRRNPADTSGGKKPECQILALVHEQCAEKDEKLGRPIMRRRMLEAEKIEALNKAGVPKSDPRRNTRAAWWCPRCEGKIRQNDSVVMVTPKRRT